MKTEVLFYPDFQVLIGPYILQRGITFMCYSDPQKPYDWCKISFTEEFQGSIQVNDKADVEIYAGYSGSMVPIFKGIVEKAYNMAGAKDEILAKDYSIKLAETKVSNTFLDVTPQELVEFGLLKAGIHDYELAEEIYPLKPVVSIIQKSVVDFLKEINSLWKVDIKSYFRLGKFYWGIEPDQEDVYIFEYGSNIISLTRSSGYWVMLTMCVPFIGHSQMIEIDHPYISGEFQIKRSCHFINEDGWLRTKLWF